MKDLLELIEGPTAIAFVEEGDMVAVAKTLSDTARDTKVLTIKGGILQGQTMTAEQVRDLAKLPPVEVLKGRTLGVIVAPLHAFVGLVGAPLRDLVGIIDARTRQLQAQEG